MPSDIAPVSDASFEQEIGAGPALVEFTGEWCPPCRRLEPILEDLARGYRGRIRFARVEAGDNPALSARFRVRAIPTLVLLCGGRVVDHVVGAAPRAAITERLERLLMACPA
jgi:thioredoxin